MKVALRSRGVLAYLLAFALLLALNQLFMSGTPGYAEQAPQSRAQSAESCPGEQMGVQATGEYRSRPVPEAVINGEPWAGAYWEAGMRSYWHCHASGQLLVIFSGEGRVQKRGERAQTLSVGESQFARPWEEHWHGATPDSDAQYLQVSFQPSGTFWMEEVSRDDYLGNDIGIATRNEFLRTGVREQP